MSDTGDGIASDQLDAVRPIFIEPTRHDATTARQWKLGLTIARAIVDHGGTLIAQSEGRAVAQCFYRVTLLRAGARILPWVRV